jgi:transcriptional regulator with XRE-family HTH domain
MTLQELFRAYGITRPSELATAAQIDRRYAWMIWHGKRRIGRKLALRLFDEKGIPLELLLRTPPAQEPKTPRGRPPTSRRRRQPPEA